MKLCYFGDGQSVHIQKWCAHFSDLGYDVHLITFRNTKIKNVKVHFINAGDITESNFHETCNSAYAPMAVTLTTEDEVDISRGDMIVHSKSVPRVSNSLKVMLVWMDENSMELNQNYDIKRGTSVVSGSFEHINYKVDVNTFERKQVHALGVNDIASCKMLLNKPIAADAYTANRFTGSFIVVDRITNNNVGAGMILGVSRREDDLKKITSKEYTDSEKALNQFIRANFPEWDCKKV